MPNILTPRTALNKAFLKQKPYQQEVEKFKDHFRELLEEINKEEREEYHQGRFLLYKEIAQPFLDNLVHELTFSHFDVRDYEKGW